MRDVVLLAVTGTLALIALRSPLVGMLSFIALSILGPASMTWGFARTFPHSQLVGLATIVGFLISADRKRLPREREVGILLALWALFVVSTAFALQPDLATNRLIFISKIFLMLFLSTMIVNTSDRLHQTVRVIGLSLGFLGAKLGLFALATGLQQKTYGPEETYLFQENAIGIALAANLPLLMYLFRVEKARWLRQAIVAMFILSYPAVVATFSRGAWISIAAVSVFLVTSSRRRLVAMLFVLVLGAGAILWQDHIVSDRLAARWDTLRNYQEDASAESRFWNWEFCRRVGMGRPFGGGFDLYSPDAYLQYYPEFAIRWPGKVWVCHSMWMEFLAEHGVLGFVLGVGLIVSCLFSTRALSRQTAGKRTRVGELAPMLGVSFVAFIAGGTFLDVAYHELFYQIIALVIVAKTLAREGADTPIEDDTQGAPAKAPAVPHEWRPRQRASEP